MNFKIIGKISLVLIASICFWFWYDKTFPLESTVISHCQKLGIKIKKRMAYIKEKPRTDETLKDKYNELIDRYHYISKYEYSKYPNSIEIKKEFGILRELAENFLVEAKNETNAVDQSQKIKDEMEGLFYCAINHSKEIEKNIEQYGIEKAKLHKLYEQTTFYDEQFEDLKKINLQNIARVSDLKKNQEMNNE